MSSAVSGLAQTVKAMRPMVPAENFEISKKFYADFGFRLSAPNGRGCGKLCARWPA